MREIKFRAWDIKEKRIVCGSEFNLEFTKDDWVLSLKEDWGLEDDDPLRMSVYGSDGSNIMQFTGLKDKNGKEIYEGDILKRDAGDIKHNGMVYLGTDGLYIVEQKEQRWAYPINEPKSWSDIFEDDEVIGNIYENPELIDANAEKEGGKK